MIRATSILESLLTDETEEKYRREGYEVSREPELEFFPGFRPDLVVRKGDQVKVIEVKARSSLAANPQLRDLARVVRSKPGWSFELLLVSEPEHLEAPDFVRSLEKDTIVSRIEEAERALEEGLPEAAFLLAWTACEAALRELVMLQGVSNSGIMDAAYALNQAVAHGVISRSDHKQLATLLKHRNAIVHGFSASDFDDRLVRSLISTVRRIPRMAALDG